MDYRVIEQATKFVRDQAVKNGGRIPDWGRFQQLVKDHLNGPYKMAFKMPNEYYYAYLRLQGLTNDEALERMGLGNPIGSRGSSRDIPAKKSFWKFW